MKALKLESVSKRFGEFAAVRGLDFGVAPGEVFGFLGGNGAGKTTSLRMVLGMLSPDTGVISVLGRPPGQVSRGQLGFIPEERGLYRSLTALETIAYFGRLKGMTAYDAKAEGRILLERFGLTRFADQKVGKLSKGMAQKIQLATAVVSQPQLLILDEPFSGLDPLNQGLLEDEILRAKHAGAAVVFSTHVMQHAERLCDRLLLMARGRKLFEGTQEQARDRLPVELLVSTTASPMGLPNVIGAVPNRKAGEWQEWSVTLAPGARSDDLLHHCTTQGFALRRFEPRRASLHEAFLHIVGQAGDEQ